MGTSIKFKRFRDKLMDILPVILLLTLYHQQIIYTQTRLQDVSLVKNLMCLDSSLVSRQ